MSIGTLFVTVLNPYFVGELLIFESGKGEGGLIYNGNPKDRQIPAWVKEKKVQEIYVAEDGELAIIVNA